MVMKKCNSPGCPSLVPKGQGKCDRHRREAERRRGSPSSRGYGREHRERFREQVLALNPICVICLRRPATEADHFPYSRDELIDLGRDPNDPQFGRGLCRSCHAASTALNQPAGWNARGRER